MSLIGPNPGQAWAAGPESVHDLTLKLLEKRRQEQILAAEPMKAFHDFQFTDRLLESQIQFEHHIVEDAGKVCAT